MKKLLLSLITIVLWQPFLAQEERAHLPISYLQRISTPVPTIELPPLNLEAVQREDSINDLDKNLPWRYGISRSLSINLEQTGVWTDLPSGDRLWQLEITSPNAVNVSVNFDDLYVPQGARLLLYNKTMTDISRPITKLENTPDGKLGSWFIDGETILLEYYEPAGTSRAVVLEIGSIIHGYRMGRVNALIENGRGLEDSGDCNYDVNCSIGPDFDPIKDVVKKAVALLNLGNGYLCSAALVNNTEANKRPFLLTANHCLEYSDPSLWSVRFNWMSPSPVCGTEEPSANLETNFTMSGAAVRANNSLSDFALVEMYNRIPDSWDVAFAGWDVTDTEPEFEVGIHHPNGDIMKICRDDSGAEKINANGTEVWLIGGVSAGSGNGWELGTTESGSSGSPLFNQEGKIIGQLYAGNSFCNGVENNGDYDIYGRLGVSWNAGAQVNRRLREWLDPLASGQTTMPTLQNVLNISDFDFEGNLEVYPNPVSDLLTIENGRYPNLTYQLFDVIGQQLKNGTFSNTMNTLDVQSLSEGIYFLQLFDPDSDAQITKKIVVSR